VIRGDPNPTNIRVADDKVVLLDWDVARIDSRLLDFAYVSEVLSGLSAEEHATGRDAFYAWEAATFWTINPGHATRRLAKLQ
jgi:thiamine kinase-like enzyme